MAAAAGPCHHGPEGQFHGLGGAAWQEQSVALYERAAEVARKLAGP